MQKAWDNPTNTQIVIAWIALVAVLTATYFLWQVNRPEVVEARATPTLQIGPVVLLERDILSVPLILSDSPEAIAGFDVSIILEGNLVATIEGASTTLGLQDIDLVSSTLVHIRAVDLNGILVVPPDDITLATIDLLALAPGTTTISVVLRRLDSTLGNPITPNLLSNTIDVTKPFPTIIGQPGRAQDIDRDGLAEDLNANGRHDFADIVIFFDNIDTLEITENVAFFDFDQDRSISLNDILAMFQILIR